MYEAPIIATAEVTRFLKADLYEIKLPNGKLSFGHFSKELRASGRQLETGAKVTIQLTPFDFDSARISSIQER